MSELCLPVASEEAFWIGLESVSVVRAVRAAIMVVTEDIGPIDPVSGRVWNGPAAHAFDVPPVLVIQGILRLDGSLWAFTRVPVHGTGPACRRIEFHAWDDSKTAAASVRLVDYVSFRELTNMAPPPPLDADAGYKGWRLP